MAEATTRRGTAIAVVGLGCRFPDADDPEGLLDAVLAGRRAFRRIPSARLSLDDYYQPGQGTPDATYSTRAALIEGWQFDCDAFGVEPAVYAASDPAHWLALETAARALESAGLPAGAGLHRDRTGVIIGNTLGGGISRASALRLRWPYVRKVLTAALAAAGVGDDQAGQVLAHAERRYLAPFPAMGPYSLAGSMPATIAAAISAYFGFRGGSHAVDSACSSSLQAVTTACAALAAGDLDAAVAGGVDLSLDPLELIGLASARLLATGHVRLYDASPSGYLPGEGCGVVVLMRSADARAAGLPLYAEIAGWGTSSGGLPGEPPSQAASQLLAMQRAYDRAGVDPADVDYIEGNGAATQAGDAAELSALASLRAGARRRAALGSVKANIGHAGAAAGAASLIKTVLAISAGVIPPATGAGQPHELIEGGDAALTLPDTVREWGAATRLAAVNATGIGGANVHLVLRSEQASRPAIVPWTAPPAADAAGLRLARPGEPLPFLLHAPDRTALAAQLAAVAGRALWLSDAELTDLACTLARDPAKQGPARAALVAGSQDELAGRARAAAGLLGGLSDGLIAAGPGVFAAEGADGRVTLLLSASEPAAADAGALRGYLDHCLDVLRWLDSLEVTATAAVGHGIGMLAGLAWAGVLGGREVAEIADLRGRFLARAAGRPPRAAARGDIWPPASGGDAAALRGAIAQRFRFGPPRRRLISAADGTELGSVEEAIDLICRGFAGEDEITAAVKAGTVGATLLLDTGPGPVLAQAAAESRVPAVSMHSGLADAAAAATAAAALYAAGAIGDGQPLFAGRRARHLDLRREQVFLTSPCEVTPARPRPAVPVPGAPEAGETVILSPDAAAAARPAGRLRPPEGVRSWTRCFTETLRPAAPPARPAPDKTWRVFAAAADPALAGLAGGFAGDPAGPRTLAVLDDPADGRCAAAAMAAARDAAATGELVVLTTSPQFTAFFATLQAENPALGVTVLRVPAGLASAAAATPWAVATPGRFRELVVSADGTAGEPELAALTPEPGGGLPLGPDDTIMITRAAGGAALVLAQVLSCAGTGVAVVGRAGDTDDTRLITGLEELREAGGRVSYEVVDVTSPAGLATAVRRIERRLGPVTAVAQAAPALPGGPVLGLSDDEITGLAAGPPGGLDRLADALGPGQLKLVITVSGVAARYGLPGAGGHALGRGALVSRAAAIAAAQPGCAHLHLDLAPLDGAGLGERPELVSALAAADTPPAGLSETSRLLLRALRTPQRPASLAVHGRISGLASRGAPAITGAQLAAAGLPGGGRFLREVAVHYPAVELICSARLSAATDPYLDDYRDGGQAVLPPALALEALAQAASVLAGRPVRQAGAVRFDAAVAIPDDGETVLRVCAHRDGDTVAAVLRSSQTGFEVDHASASFGCEPAEMPQPPAAPSSSAVAPLVSAAVAGLVDGAELYGPVCFQQGRFRRIALLPEVTARSGRAVARGADEQPWFAPGSGLSSAGFLLGSPGLNDAVLQVLQACMPDRRVRPLSCESVQFAGHEVTGPVEIRAVAGPVQQARGGRHAGPGQPAAAEQRDSAAGTEPPRRARHARRSRTAFGFERTAPPDSGPIRADRGPAADGELAGRARASRSGSAGRRQLWSVEAVSSSGQLLAAWRGIRLADAGPMPRSGAWPPALLSVFLERSGADLGLDEGLRVAISCGQPASALAAIPRQAGPPDGGGADARAEAAGRHAGGERRGLNAATAPGTGQLAGFTLTARAPAPVACAWTAIAADRPLTPAGGLAQAASQLSAGLGEDPAVIDARLAAVRTCLAAAGIPADGEVHLIQASGDGWAALAVRRARIASVVVQISGVDAPVAIALLTVRRAHARAAAAGQPAVAPP